MGSAAASDVAREAADIVLMDDNFPSLVKAIHQGRLCFSKVKKVIAYSVAHAVPELVPILVTLLFDVPLMLSGTLILVIDLLTEQLPAASLTWEAPEASLMLMPPRDVRSEHMVDFPLVLYSYVFIGLIESLLCVGAFFLAMSQQGFPISDMLYNRDYWQNPPPRALKAYLQAVSAYFFTLVACQACAHIYLVKTRRASIFTHGPFNWITPVGSALAVALAVLCIFPFSGSMFSTGYMTLATSWTLWLGFVVVALPLTEAGKAAARAAPASFWARQVQW